MRVTVTIEVVLPSATTEAGEALTVEVEAETAPATVVMVALVPVLVLGDVLVAVKVAAALAIVLVVNEVVATPLPLVVVVAGVKDPPVPVRVKVTETPEVDTALPYWSASRALMVTTEPATGLKLDEVTRYFVAAPAMKFTVAVGMITTTSLVSVAAKTSAAAVVDLTVKLACPEPLLVPESVVIVGEPPPEL